MKNLLSTRKIKIDEIIGSIPLEIKVYEFISSTPGKTVYIQSSVHGAELQGNALIVELFEYFKNADFNGRIIFVPLANPYASSHKLGTYTYGRFNPVTGDNWNRQYLDFQNLEKGKGQIDTDLFCNEFSNLTSDKFIKKFKTHIREKAKEYRNSFDKYGISENKNLFVTLQEIASEADIVLDLHTGASATRYIYSADYVGEKKMKDLNFSHYIVIPNEFGGAMDEATFMPWYNLMKSIKKNNLAHEIDFESYTVELGSEELFERDQAKKDAKNILHFLSKRGVVKEEVKVENTEQYFCKLKDYLTYNSPMAGLCDYHVKPGEHYKKGDILMSIYQMDKLDTDQYQFDILAKEDGIVIHQCPSASIKMGMELIQCFNLSV